MPAVDNLRGGGIDATTLFCAIVSPKSLGRTGGIDTVCAGGGRVIGGGGGGACGNDELMHVCVGC